MTGLIQAADKVVFKIDGMGEITFRNKTYPIREIQFENLYVTIATSELEDALIHDDEFVSDEARWIDEAIFYYVDDIYAPVNELIDELEAI